MQYLRWDSNLCLVYLASAFFKRTESGAESGAEFGPGFGAEFGAEFGAGSSAFGAESGAGFGARSGAESDAEFGTKCSDFLSIPLSKYTKTWISLYFIELIANFSRS